MKFKNNTKESYADLKGCYEHTVVLKLLDGTYRAIHIQDGCDNLDEEDYDSGYTWYIDFEIKSFENCASHSRYFSDELDAQNFYQKEEQMFDIFLCIWYIIFMKAA